MALAKRHLHALLTALTAAAAPAGASASQGGGSVRWGGQMFSNPADLVAWANARGAHTNVPDWIARHPGAASIFAGGAPSNYAGAGAGGGLPPGPRLIGPPVRRPPFPLLGRARTRPRLPRPLPY